MQLKVEVKVTPDELRKVVEDFVREKQRYQQPSLISLTMVDFWHNNDGGYSATFALLPEEEKETTNKEEQ